MPALLIARQLTGRKLATIRRNYLVEWSGFVGEVEMGPKVGQNNPPRQPITRAALEQSIAEVVKAGGADHEGFIGVVVERAAPAQPGGPNWTLKGVRYGKSNRELCAAVLSACVAEKQLQFDLSD
jgi:hypothetical protein